MSEEFALDEICRKLRTICKEEEEKASKKTHKAIHAKMLKILTKYKDLKMVVENDNTPPTLEEVEQYRDDYLRGLMEDREDNIQRVLDEDQARRVRNYVQLRDIDNAIDMYCASCNRSSSDEKKRQCRSLKMRFLDDQEWTIPQIAEKEGVVERTTQRDLHMAVDSVAYFLRPDSEYFD